MVSEKSIWYALTYYRLSKDDYVDKESGNTSDQQENQRYSGKESNSIMNQRKLIQEFISGSEDIIFVEEFFDDGFTGTNFERPGFQKLMAALREGRGNCVIVKDLSRLGRDYIETGKMIEKVFPSLNTRFIAINDQIDSLHGSQSDEIIIPFKNLINDSYCRELSNKLRRQFRIQRQNGEFIANFAFYGYMRSAEDKHKLVVDEPAAEVVKLIYAKMIEGYSCKRIADFLNEIGIPSPCEYKKSAGSNYVCAFKEKAQSLWGAVTVRRILTNRIYLGYLEQGKTGTPNYKIKTVRRKAQEDWIVVKGAHEAIISEEAFLVVQKLLERDTLTAHGNETVYPLSGMLFCGDCHEAMTRYKAKRGNRSFCYYICSGHKWKRGCTSNHSMEVNSLHEKIFHAIQLQISLVVEMEEVLRKVGDSAVLSAKCRRLDALIEQNRKEMEKQQDFRMKLYENQVSGIINHEEYVTMKKKYSDRIDKIGETIMKLEQERENVCNASDLQCGWMKEFIKNQGASELSRQLVVTLIDRVEIFEDKSVEITFNFRDEFAELNEFLEQSVTEAGEVAVNG